MTAAGLTFLAWVRSGLVSGVGRPAGATGNALDDKLPPMARVPVSLTLAQATTTYSARLAGPGDVVGLDIRQVIRCDPPHGATDARSNDFPLIEFDRPDLPWMLTPDTPSQAGLTDADARRGLRPWLCLVVVPDRALDPPAGVRPLPRLTVSDAELPDLESAWLWAHAQVVTQAGDDLAKVIRDHPDRTLSRLMAPRRLAPGISYVACVVPAFEAGRRAGLGLIATLDAAQAPAWIKGPQPLDTALPVYYSWRFTTSRLRGDFETLAARLHAVRQGRAGVRAMDVGHGGSGLPQPAANAVPWLLDLEGALIGDQVVPGAWPQGTWGGPLKEQIALRLAASITELAPPTYGALQAGYAGDLRNGHGPQWLRDINLDPRYRATASLGAQIVQKHQEALVASAWEQTSALREANRLLRQAQLARAVGESLHRRLGGSSTLGPDRLLQMTRQVHGQIRSPGAGALLSTTLAGNVGVVATVSVAFRRSVRPAGPLARRLLAAPLPAPLARLALPAASPGALRPTPELKAVPGTIHLGALSALANAPESIAALTVTRVMARTFPWEIQLTPSSPPAGAPAPAAPLDAQGTASAYLSDMSVLGSSMAIGTGMDFDGGIPRNGWTSAPDDLGFFDGRCGVAYAERGESRMVAKLGFYDERQGQVNNNTAVQKFGLTYRVKTGYVFDSGGSGTQALVDLSQVPERWGFVSFIHAAITTADIKGTGAIDLIVFWVLEANWVRRIHWDSSENRWYRRVFCQTLFDVDPQTGGARGGRGSVIDLGDWDGERFSISAKGARLYLCTSRSLLIRDMKTNGDWVNVSEIRINGQLPEDVVSTAIYAADFGGSVGTDLLIACVCGSGPSARANYRVALDVQPGRPIAAWGPTYDIPVAADWGRLDICVGASAYSTNVFRKYMSDYFRADAAMAQDRQLRIAALASPPAPAPAVDTAPLVTALRSAIDPRVTVPASVTARLALSSPIDPQVVRDTLQPLALTPRFPYPSFQLLRESFPERLFPGAADLPEDGVVVLLANRHMIEALLVGMNHELSRELIWREFPVRHGTFFSTFWEASREEISPVESWQAGVGLGQHGPEGEPGLLLLATRAELFRRIPTATVYASPAKVGAGGRGRTVDTRTRREPLFKLSLDADIRVFAFDLTPAAARGTGTADGWYFVLQEHPGAPRFGLDEADAGFGSVPQKWSELAWPQVVRTQQEFSGLAYVDGGKVSALAGTTLADGGSSALEHRWGFSAAHTAHITLQRPVQLAIHGSRLIDPGVGA